MADKSNLVMSLEQEASFEAKNFMDNLLKVPDIDAVPYEVSTSAPQIDRSQLSATQNLWFDSGYNPMKNQAIRAEKEKNGSWWDVLKDFSYNTFVSGWNSDDIPFAGDVIVGKNLYDLHNISTKLEKGEELDDIERKTFKDYVTKMNEEEQRSWWEQAGETSNDMVSFFAEIGLMAAATYYIGGSGVAVSLAKKAGIKTGKAAGKKAMGRIIRKGLSKKIASGAMAVKVPEAIANVGAGLATSAAYGAVMASFGAPTAVYKKVAQREVSADFRGLSEDERSFVLDAYLDHTAEVVSEVSGQHLMQGVGSTFRALGGGKITDKIRKMALSRILVKTVQNKFGGKMGKPIAKKVNQLVSDYGWNGMIGEMLEERYGDTLRALYNVEGDFGDTPNLHDAILPDLRQIKIEALSFGLGGAAMQAVQRGSMYPLVRAQQAKIGKEIKSQYEFLNKRDDLTEEETIKLKHMKEMDIAASDSSVGSEWWDKQMDVKEEVRSFRLNASFRGYLPEDSTVIQDALVKIREFNESVEGDPVEYYDFPMAFRDVFKETSLAQSEDFLASMKGMTEKYHIGLDEAMDILGSSSKQSREELVSAIVNREFGRNNKYFSKFEVSADIKKEDRDEMRKEMAHSAMYTDIVNALDNLLVDVNNEAFLNGASSYMFVPFDVREDDLVALERLRLSGQRARGDVELFIQAIKDNPSPAVTKAYNDTEEVLEKAGFTKEEILSVGAYDFAEFSKEDKVLLNKFVDTFYSQFADHLNEVMAFQVASKALVSSTKANREASEVNMEAVEATLVELSKEFETASVDRGILVNANSDGVFEYNIDNILDDYLKGMKALFNFSFMSGINSDALNKQMEAQGGAPAYIKFLFNAEKNMKIDKFDSESALLNALFSVGIAPETVRKEEKEDIQDVLAKATITGMFNVTNDTNKAPSEVFGEVVLPDDVKIETTDGVSDESVEDSEGTSMKADKQSSDLSRTMRQVFAETWVELSEARAVDRRYFAKEFHVHRQLDTIPELPKFSKDPNYRTELLLFLREHLEDSLYNVLAKMEDASHIISFVNYYSPAPVAAATYDKTHLLHKNSPGSGEYRLGILEQKIAEGADAESFAKELMEIQDIIALEMEKNVFLDAIAFLVSKGESDPSFLYPRDEKGYLKNTWKWNMTKGEIHQQTTAKATDLYNRIKSFYRGEAKAKYPNPNAFRLLMENPLKDNPEYDKLLKEFNALQLAMKSLSSVGLEPAMMNHFLARNKNLNTKMDEFYNKWFDTSSDSPFNVFYALDGISPDMKFEDVMESFYKPKYGQSLPVHALGASMAVPAGRFIYGPDNKKGGAYNGDSQLVYSGVNMKNVLQVLDYKKGTSNLEDKKIIDERMITSLNLDMYDQGYVWLGQFGDRFGLHYYKIDDSYKDMTLSDIGVRYQAAYDAFVDEVDGIKSVHRKDVLTDLSNLHLTEWGLLLSKRDSSEQGGKKFYYSQALLLEQLIMLHGADLDVYGADATNILKRSFNIMTSGIRPRTEWLNEKHDYIVVEAPPEVNDGMTLALDLKPFFDNIGALGTERIPAHLKAQQSGLDTNGNRILWKSLLVQPDKIKGNEMYQQAAEIMKARGLNYVVFTSGQKVNPFTGNKVNVVSYDDFIAGKFNDNVKHTRDNRNWVFTTNLHQENELKATKKLGIQIVKNLSHIPVMAEMITNHFASLPLKVQDILATGAHVKYVTDVLKRQENPELNLYTDANGLFDFSLWYNESANASKIMENFINEEMVFQLKGVQLVTIPSLRKNDTPSEMRETKDGQVLGRIDTSLPESEDVRGEVEVDSLAKAKAGAKLHEDCFVNGKLQEQELQREDGQYIIPGSISYVARIPHDDVHSGALVRVRNTGISGDNVIIVPPSIQAWAGEDNDGDVRHFYFGKEVLGMADYYYNPKNFARISDKVDTQFFEGTDIESDEVLSVLNSITGRTAHDGTFNFGFSASKTSFSFEQQTQVGFRNMTLSGKGLLEHFAKLTTGYNALPYFYKDQDPTSFDEYNAFSKSLGTLLNLAADNAKEQKLGAYGFSADNHAWVIDEAFKKFEKNMKLYYNTVEDSAKKELSLSLAKLAFRDALNDAQAKIKNNPQIKLWTKDTGLVYKIRSANSYFDVKLDTERQHTSPYLDLFSPLLPAYRETLKNISNLPVMQAAFGQAFYAMKTMQNNAFVGLLSLHKDGNKIVLSDGMIDDFDNIPESKRLEIQEAFKNLAPELKEAFLRHSLLNPSNKGVNYSHLSGSYLAFIPDEYIKAHLDSLDSLVTPNTVSATSDIVYPNKETALSMGLEGAQYLVETNTYIEYPDYLGAYISNGSIENGGRTTREDVEKYKPVVEAITTVGGDVNTQNVEAPKRLPERLDKFIDYYKETGKFTELNKGVYDTAKIIDVYDKEGNLIRGDSYIEARYARLFLSGRNYLVDLDAKKLLFKNTSGFDSDVVKNKINVEAQNAEEEIVETESPSTPESVQYTPKTGLEEQVVRSFGGYARLLDVLSRSSAQEKLKLMEYNPELLNDPAMADAIKLMQEEKVRFAPIFVAETLDEKPVLGYYFGDVGFDQSAIFFSDPLTAKHEVFHYKFGREDADAYALVSLMDRKSTMFDNYKDLFAPYYEGRTEAELNLAIVVEMAADHFAGSMKFDLPEEYMAPSSRSDSIMIEGNKTDTAVNNPGQPKIPLDDLNMSNENFSHIEEVIGDDSLNIYHDLDMFRKIDSGMGIGKAIESMKAEFEQMSKIFEPKSVVPTMQKFTSSILSDWFYQLDLATSYSDAVAEQMDTILMKATRHKSKNERHLLNQALYFALNSEKTQVKGGKFKNIQKYLQSRHALGKDSFVKALEIADIIIGNEHAGNMAKYNLSQSDIVSMREMYDEYEKAYNDAYNKFNQMGLKLGKIIGYAPTVYDTSHFAEVDENDFVYHERHTRHRTFADAISGLAENHELELKYTTATEAHEKYVQRMFLFAHNKQFLKMAMNTYDRQGNPYLRTTKTDGFKELKHSIFREMVLTTLTEIPAGQEKKYVKVRNGKGGSEIFEIQKYYVHPELARRVDLALRADMGTFKITKSTRVNKAFKNLFHYTMVLKQVLLQLSLFHARALFRSFFYGAAWRGFDGFHLFREKNIGLKTMEEAYAIENPREAFNNLINNVDKSDETILRFLYAHGMSSFASHDLKDAPYHEGNFITRTVGKIPIANLVMDKLVAGSHMWNKYMFGNLGAGLKARAGVLEFKHAIEKFGAESMQDYEAIAQKTAALMNADFGGLNLKREDVAFGLLGRSPKMQQFLKFAMLAPDWTESNMLAFAKALSEDPQTRKLSTQFISRIVFRAGVVALLANVVMALAYSAGADDDDDLPFYERFLRMYTDAWERGELAWLMIDITPMAKLMGYTDEEAKLYFSPAGHFVDYLETVPDLEEWLHANQDKRVLDPTEGIHKNATNFMHHKGSLLWKTLWATMVGKDYSGREFTTAQELFGTTDDYYKRGEKKGLHKTRGRLSRSEVNLTLLGNMNPLHRIQQLPSIAANTVLSMVPISLQKSIREMERKDETFMDIGIELSKGVVGLNLNEVKDINARFAGDPRNRKMLDAHWTSLGILNSLRQFMPGALKPSRVVQINNIINFEAPEMEKLIENSVMIGQYAKNGLPDWLAAKITEKDFSERDKFGRPSSSNWDYYNVVNGKQFEDQLDPRALRNYKNYHRFHYVPSGDFGKLDQRTQTFHMLNAGVGDAKLNIGMWNHMEKMYRSIAKNHGTVHTITGPVADDFMPYLADSRTKIPQRFYKILLHEDEDKQMHYLAFLLPNKAPEGNLFDYSVSLKEVEAVTGIDFVTDLDEEDVNLQYWTDMVDPKDTLPRF